MVTARWCPDCETWLHTHEYTVDEIGETICPECEVATAGSIAPGVRGTPKADSIRFPSDAARDAAIREGLAEA